MTVIISNLAIAGYRSFGKQTQYCERFAKINLFIGRNNAGKSNVIRFISEVYPRLREHKGIRLDVLASHLPSKPPMIVGFGEEVITEASGEVRLPDDHRILSSFPDLHRRQQVARLLAKVLVEKAKIDGTGICWTLVSLSDRTVKQETWLQAIRVLQDHEVESIWRQLQKASGGSRKQHWDPEVLKQLWPSPDFPDGLLSPLSAARTAQG